MKNAIFQEIRGNNSGSLVLEKIDFARFQDIKGSFLYSNQNGGFIVMKGGELFIENSFFLEVEARFYGGVIYINNKGSLHLYNVTGKNCFSQISGGFLSADMIDIS